VVQGGHFLKKKSLGANSFPNQLHLSLCEVKIIFFGGKWSHTETFFADFEKTTVIKSEGLFLPKK